jgi:hypothetical protein
MEDHCRWCGTKSRAGFCSEECALAAEALPELEGRSDHAPPRKKRSARSIAAGLFFGGLLLATTAWLNAPGGARGCPGAAGAPDAAAPLAPPPRADEAHDLGKNAAARRPRGGPGAEGALYAGEWREVKDAAEAAWTWTGETVVVSSLDKELIRRVIKRAMPEIRRCYERALAIDPGLSGKLVVTFEITPAGEVGGRWASPGLSAWLDRCVLDQIGRLSFPSPGAGRIEVSYPFMFDPAGGL